MTRFYWIFKGTMSGLPFPESPDEIAAMLEGPFAELVPAVRADLAESATGPTIKADLRWVQDALAVLGSANSTIFPGG